MKTVLIKKADGWYNLYDGKIGIGSTYPELQGHKLSVVNCDELFGKADVNGLSEKSFEYMGYHSTVTPHEEKQFKLGYRLGFNEATELGKDKQFTSEEVHKLIRLVHTLPNRELEVYENENNVLQIDDFISHYLEHPTEIEVEIVMEPMDLDEIREQGGGFLNSNTNKPKLDKHGCLILRKIES